LLSLLLAPHSFCGKGAGEVSIMSLQAHKVKQVFMKPFPWPSWIGGWPRILRSANSAVAQACVLEPGKNP